MSGQTFAEFFEHTATFTPYEWQQELGQATECVNRLIRIPTGMGKTEGVLAAWMFNVLEHGRDNGRQDAWPRRLVWCLPMRVLVEQTAERARAMIDRWAAARGLSNEEVPRVHLLMGGEDSDQWWLHPERRAVLIGTQDMLLSRALNRGFASSRARWPIEYGLLNQDSLWVMDEVQLMDVGLATSAQIQAFRDEDRNKELRPCRTWWMSATLQSEWLRSVDTEACLADWTRALCRIPSDQRSGGLWKISKQVDTAAIAERDAKALASRILEEHERLQDTGHGRITLVVLNTVQRALDTHAALQKAGRTDGLELVHSRFRPVDRTKWSREFLHRDACSRGADRIIVATQVIEAGVDMSAGCLITELAPWPSLVQRFGRCARYGGFGRIIVVDRGRDDKTSAPYSANELHAAWVALQSLQGAGLSALESFEESLDSEALANLYRYDPPHLLTRDEFDELFDTTPDLTGADLDISRFIRSGDQRDLQVFWADIPAHEAPHHTRHPHRDELCAIPFLEAQDWLCAKDKLKLRDGMRAWVWDWLDGEWVTAKREMLLPGRIVCVAATCGGYSAETGFAPASTAVVDVVPHGSVRPFDELLEEADIQQDGEPLSATTWKTIATHSSEVESAVGDLAARLRLEDGLARILKLAARWHDFGKSHPAFQGKIIDAAREPRPDRDDLAKAPSSAWRQPPGRYVFRGDEEEERPGFRHELASALALFSVLRRYAPAHAALLGPWKELLDQFRIEMPRVIDDYVPAEVEAVLSCDAEEFDLLAYLVASHHGKVRVALHAAPADQDYRLRPGDNRGLPIRGVRNGDVLPSIPLTPKSHPLPELELTLSPAELGLSFETGASWRERTQGLMARLGAPSLALLEAVLRAADIRASQLTTPDPLVRGGAEESV